MDYSNGVNNLEPQENVKQQGDKMKTKDTFLNEHMDLVSQNVSADTVVDRWESLKG